MSHRMPQCKGSLPPSLFSMTTRDFLDHHTTVIADVGSLRIIGFLAFSKQTVFVELLLRKPAKEEQKL